MSAVQQQIWIVPVEDAILGPINVAFQLAVYFYEHIDNKPYAEPDTIGPELVKATYFIQPGVMVYVTEEHAIYSVQK